MILIANAEKSKLSLKNPKKNRKLTLFIYRDTYSSMLFARILSAELASEAYYTLDFWTIHRSHGHEEQATDVIVAVFERF